MEKLKNSRKRQYRGEKLNDEKFGANFLRSEMHIIRQETETFCLGGRTSSTGLLTKKDFCISIYQN